MSMIERKPRGRRRESITDDRKDQIVGLINRWSPNWEKLTGPGLETKVKSTLGLTMTRQGMLKHVEIQDAFIQKRKELAGDKPKRQRALGEELLRQRIHAQAELIKRLEKDLGDYENLFVRYHYNAVMKGISVEDLEQPMPSPTEP